MQTTTLREIAEWSGGRLIQGMPEDRVSVVSTDTRSLSGGELFVALSGEHFDGHRFIAEAGEAGAVAVMVSSLPLAAETFAGGIIHVPDTLTGLQSLALRYRRARSDVFAVGLTGSNGKTSTKDFLAAVLSRAGSVNATRGNLNNHIGLPLTILRTEAGHRIGVWEMGMSHPGEIEVLAEIAAPDAGVITNIGTAHIEHMKTREAIAEEKGMLAEAVSGDGFVVLNANDPYTEAIRGRCRARVVTAGIAAGEVMASDPRVENGGVRFLLQAKGDGVEVRLPVPGEHMVANAVLAAAVGIERGISLDEIAGALGAAELSGGRLELRRVRGVEILDDTYNANPDSMRAALRTLASMPTDGRRIAVLGRMAELGEHEDAEHRDLGAAAAEAGVDVLVAVGEKVASLISAGADGGVERVITVSSHDAAAEALGEVATEGDVVLVKGSRSSAMERVIAAYAAASQA